MSKLTELNILHIWRETTQSLKYKIAIHKTAVVLGVVNPTQYTDFDGPQQWGLSQKNYSSNHGQHITDA